VSHLVRINQVAAWLELIEVSRIGLAMSQQERDQLLASAHQVHGCSRSGSCTLEKSFFGKHVPPFCFPPRCRSAATLYSKQNGGA
jgi:hypothetical protein